jgi:xanthine dehydrogenase YagS FAD-binding subunit
MANLTNGVVSDARIVLGGVAPLPWRLRASEAVLKGKGIGTGLEAACRAAVTGARPLTNNAYKVSAIKGMVEKALTSLA